MEYRHVSGPVYCRFAHTPPIVNSELASRYGIEAPSAIDLNVVSGDSLKEGKDVKLRFLLDGRTKQMTCHAKVDYVVKDESTGDTNIGFGQLSFSDEEFGILMESFTDVPAGSLEFTPKVRDKGMEAKPVSSELKLAEATRIKAVALPVAMIDEIDSKRGDATFSDFVTRCVREHLKGC